MSQRSERRQAREALAGGNHRARLAELVAHVAEAIDRFRGGELDAFTVGEVLFRYSRAAKELSKFCTIGDVEFTGVQVDEGPPIDWWERGAPARTRPPVNEVPIPKPAFPSRDPHSHSAACRGHLALLREGACATPSLGADLRMDENDYGPAVRA